MSPQAADDPLVRVAPEVALIVAPGVLWLEGAVVVEADARLDAPLAEAERRARASPPREREAVRRMYRKIGLDPTRTRPSSEALARRIRRGEALPRVNTLVDVCNWCSLELQLPYGLYDLDRIEGAVELRLGRPGEEYAGIRKDVIHVDGRLVAADGRGPFGNPTSDSARTMVTTGTTRALVVIFAPRDTGKEAVEEALNLTASRASAYAGARVSRRLAM